MLTQRAWSILEVKSLDAEKRILTGIASTPSPDRQHDVMVPEGAKFTLPMPLLWQHRDPIGEVFDAKVTSKGIEIQARIAQIDEPGMLKDRLDLAWQSIKAKLVKGLSIGWRPLKETYDKVTGNFIYPEWEWYELSAVVIPANAEATIRNIKSLDVGLDLSVSEPVVESKLAGVPASSRVSTRNAGHRQMAKKTYAEQIKEWEATRQAKAAELATVMEKTAESGELPDAAEQETVETLKGEIKSIDAHLVTLRDVEQMEKDAVLTEVKGATPREAAITRQPAQRITVTRELPKGILFARYAMCIGAARGFPGEAMRLAKQYYPDDPGVTAMIELSQKTAVAGAATTGSHYIDDMVPYSVMNDFIEYLRPGSIVGKFGGPNPGGGGNYPSLNRVGFNERVSGMSTGFSAAWVGEGLPTLPSAAVTFNAALLFHKLGALAILTKEAIRFSNPSAEARVRDDLARAINAKMDLDFVDPAKAAVGATSPASITDGIAATAPSGTAATNVRKDIATLLALFAANNLDASDLVLIMSASMAAQISMMTNTLGNDDFPLLSMRGGSLRGIPVIVSEHLTAVGSPSTQTIIAVKAGDIYLADDGAVTVEASDQASVEMQDTSSQSGITGTGASLVSLWQNSLVGLKAQREVTWKRRRTTAVQYISPAAYVAA